MKKRNIFSVFIFVFIILGLFAACGDSDGSNTVSNAPGSKPIPTPGASLADKLAWLRNNAESDSTYLLEITSVYEELAPQNISYPGRNNITVRLKGIGIGRAIGCSSFDSSSSSSPLFNVGDGVTLILDENIILYKDDFYNNSSPAIQVISGGTLIMNQGAKITKFNNGAVNVGGGTFTMNGGEISGNTAISIKNNNNNNGSGSGGGVYVGNGTFTMSGGEISGNTASFNFNFSDSDDVNGIGGGVYISGTFIKSGGIITGYTSDTVKGNVVKGNNGVVQNDKGHAVYFSSTRYRNTTAGETDQIDTTTGKGLSADGNSPFGQ